MLALLLVLRPQDQPAHRRAGQLPLAVIALAEPRGGLLAEGLDDLVLQRDEELGVAGVALPGAAAGELAVDAPGLVPLGADDVQAALLGHPRAQLDVGAAAGHVRRDR